MSHFAGMEDMLQDFLLEAGDMLSGVDNKLVDLEKRPDDNHLLNDIFRGFHTIKGGAGFLKVDPLVDLCHKTENLFDKLRNGSLSLTRETMDVIMDATAKVREMFDHLAQHAMPESASPSLLAALDAALAGQETLPVPQEVLAAEASASETASADNEYWAALYRSLAPNEAVAVPPTESVADVATVQVGGAQDAKAPSISKPQAAATPAKESTIRIDTARLDQVLTYTGEIGLAKNRIVQLKRDLLSGRTDADTLKALDEAVGHLDLLVGDLQNAVMKTRMQPIGRLFQKYPRLARDLGRQLGKEIELVITGEETEIDKTMIEDLNDPLVHLVRNAVDHGVETPAEREAAGKPAKSAVHLNAYQIGDHICIEIKDDGKGMRPEAIRSKAVEKGLISAEDANGLDDKQSLGLVFLPGFSTKDQISDVSGRGVGMDVVKTNITRLNGRIEIDSVVGKGTTFTIYLPLTLAILPVLVVLLGEQQFALPLSLVREILPIQGNDVQRVSGKNTLVVRDEVLPVRPLADLLGWPRAGDPAYGALLQASNKGFVLGVDGFVGRDDVVVKPVDMKPKGVSGATLSGDGQVTLVLDIEALLA